ncbi:MAG: phosphoserine transaminase [Propionibacteriaceae bacterium]|jgi:phosphoserine aminotransferase|nr:phosphoserine transaminase [Propionibacteriaceae bacterium]
MTDIIIPTELLPRDGRFGSGPAKVRPDALAQLGAANDIMGTSHRRDGVKNVVKSVQEQLAALYSLPDGYQVVLGNGGASLFWDMATVSLIQRRSSHGVCGEFSRKFADNVAAAPFLAPPIVQEAPLGSSIVPLAGDDADVYAWAQNETSTGVQTPVLRPLGSQGDLVLIDATSAAGGMDADIAATDVYYFSPQKNFSSDGGLFIAFCSPAALERSRIITASDRWVPPILNLTTAADNSEKNQTLNTPAIATLLLLDYQLQWIMANGGMQFITSRTGTSSSLVYDWAEKHSLATPFVARPEMRSPVVATIDFDEGIDTKALIKVLNANGIVDIDPYRSLGRNQLRIGVYASVEPSDVSALLASIDYVVERLA